MDRRSFLSILAGAGAALAFDPEKLLWVPGAKTIFIPKPEYIPQDYVNIFQGTMGVCNGIPIPLNAVDTTRMGPLFEDAGCVYRLVELLPDTRIYWNGHTIFAVPAGKLQVLVKGPTPLRGPIDFGQPAGFWL